MRRHTPLCVALLFLGALLRGALAAPVPAAYLPTVRNGAQPTATAIPATTRILYDGASSLNSAVAMKDTREGAAPGALRFFVAWAKVPVYRLDVDELVNGQLVPVPGVPAVVLAEPVTSPAWSPDLPKNGNASLVPIPGGLKVVYTGRKPGEPTGPFVLWEATVPIAGVAP